MVEETGGLSVVDEGGGTYGVDEEDGVGVVLVEEEVDDSGVGGLYPHHSFDCLFIVRKS